MFLIIAYLITAFTLWDITWIMDAAEFHEIDRFLIAVVFIGLALVDYREFQLMKINAKPKGK